MDCAAIIPTYNEAENLPALVAQLLALPERIHVIVVDDNSPDGTGRIADELAAADGRVIVRHRAAKLGLGTAYVTGFRTALERGFDRILTMDADFSHHPRYVPSVIALTDKADLGIGLTGGVAGLLGAGVVVAVNPGHEMRGASLHLTALG